MIEFGTLLIDMNTLVLFAVVVLFFLAKHTLGIAVFCLMVIVLVTVAKLLVSHTLLYLLDERKAFLAERIDVYTFLLFLVVDFILRALSLDLWRRQRLSLFRLFL